MVRRTPRKATTPVPGTPPPPTPRRASSFEAAMAAQAETARDDRAIAAERQRRIGALAADRQRAHLKVEAALAEQQRRTRAGEGTPLEEVLNGHERSVAREFMHFLRSAYEDDGRDRYELAATLPVGEGDQRRNVRGFLIGCAGEEPGDSSWLKSSRGLYLCEDGTLRTYRRPDGDVDPADMPPAQGVPINPATGEYTDILPGYFTQTTAPRRRIVKLVDGKVPPLPPGVESASGVYRDSGSKVLYQSHDVHLFRTQSLEESLAATAYYAIQEEAARPVYDRYSPTA